MNPWLMLLYGYLAAALLMALLWLLQRRTGDAGIVDVAWAGAIGGLSVCFALGADGDPVRRCLIAILAGLWSMRLAIYLLIRVITLPEDGRYQQLREKWGDKTQRNLFVFFQVQATWAVLFAAPMLIAARNDAPFPHVMDLLGIAVWLIALGGEALADRQLARFRRNPENKGRVCDTGLWRYSRHPNYFFEWTHWWTYVLIGWWAPLGYLTLLGPATMLFFLLKVTGIPPTEARAIQSRGEAYRRYQQTTSVFFPWLPSHPPSEKSS